MLQAIPARSKKLSRLPLSVAHIGTVFIATRAQTAVEDGADGSRNANTHTLKARKVQQAKHAPPKKSYLKVTDRIPLPVDAAAHGISVGDPRLPNERRQGGRRNRSDLRKPRVHSLAAVEIEERAEVEIKRGILERRLLVAPGLGAAQRGREGDSGAGKAVSTIFCFLYQARRAHSAGAVRQTRLGGATNSHNGIQYE